MRFLADENFPRPSVLLLRDAGWEVEAIGEVAPGTSDHDVLFHAYDHQQFLLTFDRDFGELVYRESLPTPVGIIYFRLDPTDPEEPGRILLTTLHRTEIDLANRFTVLERDRLRQRLLQSPQ